MWCGEVGGMDDDGGVRAPRSFVGGDWLVAMCSVDDASDLKGSGLWGS